MYIKFFFIVMLALVLSAAGVYMSKHQHLDTKVDAATFAQNVHVLGRYAGDYAGAHDTTTSAVSTTTLGTPSWFAPYPGLQAYVSNGSAYVYFPAGSSVTPSQALTFVAGPQITAGLKAGVSIKDATGRALPISVPMPGAIPDGSMVYISRDVVPTPASPAPGNTTQGSPGALPAGAPLGPPQTFPGFTSVPVAWTPNAPAWKNPPSSTIAASPPPPPPPPAVLTGVDLTAIPTLIETFTTTGAKATLIFNPTGTFATAKSPRVTGNWMTAGPASNYEVQVVAKTSWMDDSSREHFDTTTSAWLNMANTITVQLGDSSCNGGGIYPGVNYEPSSVTTVTVRSALDHTLTLSRPVSFDACGGCFAKGTEVRMADGSSMPIERIKRGDLVASFVDSRNPRAFTQEDVSEWHAPAFNDMRAAEAKVEVASPFKHTGGITIDGISSTRRHIYLTSNHGYRFSEAASIKGDIELVDSEGHGVPIRTRSVFKDTRTFVHLTTSTGTFMVRAPGSKVWILVHNLSANNGDFGNPFSVK